MSRAFTKEQDSVELLPRTEPELPAGARNHITPAGAARFRARREAVARERAALGADPLDEARRLELDAEARWLDRRIGTFVETAAPAAPERAGFGTEVTLQGERGERRIRIVGVDEADAASGCVSWCSPVAAALHGASVGDCVVIETPAGEEVWEVLALAAIA